ncbi:MAG: DUF2283 domain-containing protein [Melioribacteraceae bacterium]|nr:DUF2283 domain-containing protein [Bacteroidales bacterium]MCF6270616.1 DUF2283 domain-containing protein [Melioribacteraceae bacterium]
MINISYDKETDILDIKFSNEKIIDSELNQDTGLIVDYDENNKIVGIEILSFSKKTSKNSEIEALAI